MAVATDINFSVFGHGDFPVEEGLLDGLTENQRNLAREMMQSGHYVGGIYIPAFLDREKTIQLEKLELAVTLAVKMLESSSKEDATLLLRGLDDYYIQRGIKGNAKLERQERTFVLGFISSVASEASERDTLVIKYSE